MSDATGGDPLAPFRDRALVQEMRERLARMEGRTDHLNDVAEANGDTLHQIADKLDQLIGLAGRLVGQMDTLASALVQRFASASPAALRALDERLTRLEQPKPGSDGGDT